jgi:hypothetical protein
MKRQTKSTVRNNTGNNTATSAAATVPDPEKQLPFHPDPSERATYAGSLEFWADWYVLKAKLKENLAGGEIYEGLKKRLEVAQWVGIHPRDCWGLIHGAERN